MTADHATPAEEEYLQTVFWLFEAGLPMTGANLSRAMQLSAPTVHEMLGRLERDGYIVRDSERAIDFTPSGRQHAERIVSRHRMIERFLTDVVGVPWDDVHEEAEHLEHAMTPRFEAYVRSSVGDAKTCHKQKYVCREPQQGPYLLQPDDGNSGDKHTGSGR